MDRFAQKSKKVQQPQSQLPEIISDHLFNQVDVQRMIAGLEGQEQIIPKPDTIPGITVKFEDIVTGITRVIEAAEMFIIQFLAVAQTKDREVWMEGYPVQGDRAFILIGDPIDI